MRYGSVQVSSFEADWRRRRWPVLWLAVTAFVTITTSAAEAVVFYARDEAMSLAFPDAERVEARDFFLTAAQRAAIEEAAKSKVESDLLTVYVGHRNGSISGYAVLDTHVVRTLPETFLIVLGVDGHVRAMHVLAFYEPTEYMPNEQWLRQFHEQRDPKRLRVGREVAAITGSTLTSHAVTAAVRRALAIYDVLLQSE
jgi:hypothetical protein